MARLSAVWFTYFIAVGLYFPYFSLYLRENAGLDGTELGLILAVWPLVGIVVQPLWGHLADRTGARTVVVAVACCGSAAGFLVLGRAEGFVPILLGSILAAGFGTAILPLLFSVSMAALEGRGRHAFGRARVWGTVSFLLAVVALPPLLERYERWQAIEPVTGGPTHPGLGIMFPLIAIFTVAAAGCALAIRRSGAVAVRARQREWRRLIGYPPLWRLVAFTMLAYAFVQGPMSIFPVWVTARGGTIETVSQMWIVMLVLEIPLVAYAGSVFRRIGSRGLLQVGVLAAGVRWLVCGLATDPTLLYAIQLLHAVVVTGLMLGAPLYLDEIVPERLRSTGQSVLAVAGLGVGSIISNFGSGWLLQAYGPNAPYVVGGFGALALGLATRWMLPLPRRLVVAESSVARDLL